MPAPDARFILLSSQTAKNPLITPATSCAQERRQLYFPSLDGLRFCAFLLVFVHHLPASQVAFVRAVQQCGWAGVHLFLMLSAYLLTAILLEEHRLRGRISIGHFWIRRGLRIWPLYFAFCAIAAIYTAMRSGWAVSDTVRLGGLVLFLDNILSGLKGYNPLRFSSHLWTISLEEQFYLVLPWLLAKWFLPSPQSAGFGLASIWLLFLILRTTIVACGGWHPLIWTSLASADSLLLGTYLGMRTRTRHGLGWQVAAFLCGSALLCAGLVFPPIEQTGAHQIAIYSIVAAGAGLICLVTIEADWLQPLLAAFPARYLGKISYGLYVYHLLAIALAERIVDKPAKTWIGTFLLALFICIFLSIASYEVFEKRFLRLKSRFEAVATRPA
jgi:peptidoglycan/LPS O-acetylase OafA/YrhL